MADKRAVYIDTCCFIDGAKLDLRNEKVRLALPAQELKDAENVRRILTAAKDSAIRAFTSGLTIAECTSIEKGQSKPSEEAKALFRALLLSNKVVSLVQPDIFLCEKARDLRWENEIVLGGADAVHVATALHKECSEFITTDRGILKRAKDLLVAFGLRVVRPSATACLPDDYKQLVMPWGTAAKPRAKRSARRKAS